MKQVDKVIHPQKLNPDDAKVIFHPVDYAVFNGMKDSNMDGLKTSCCSKVKKKQRKQEDPEEYH